MSLQTSRVLISFWVAWLLLIAGGYSCMIIYAETEGDIGVPPEQRIEDSALPYDSSNLTVYFFLHPDCPCSVASMKEFADVLSFLPPKTLLCPVFLMPPESSEQTKWRASSLYQAALALPDATIYEDINGAEMEKWGAKTSGVIAVFAPGGNLIFWGGITQNRGHVGDNASKTSLIQSLQNSASNVTTTSVYGCGLSTNIHCQ